jgi:hypothetical protein
VACADESCQIQADHACAILETAKIKVRVYLLEAKGYKLEIDVDARKEMAETPIKDHGKVRV